MKTKNLLISTILIVSAFASGCTGLSGEEGKVIGKYYYSHYEATEATDEDPAMTISIEGTQVYQKDKTTSMSGTFKALYEIEDYDYYNVVTLEYRIEASGTWELKGKTLAERADPQSVRLEFVSSSATDNDEISRRTIKIFKQHFDAYIPEMKKELLNSISEIVEINDNEMILDEDGEEITYTRIN